MQRSMIVLCAALLLAAPLVLAVEPPAIQWLRTFPKGTRTQGCWVAQTDDGGYVAAGTWRPDNESFDFYLLKTDSVGTLLWDKPLGVGPVAWARSGGLTADGGCILTGLKQERSPRALLAKCNAQGDTQWCRLFEADSAHDLEGFSVQQTRDGGYVVGGYADFRGIYLIKTDSAGHTEWQRVFREGFGITYSGLLPVRQTMDGGYIVGTARDTVLRLMKTDTAGNVQWDRTYAGQGVSGAYELEQTRDHGYAVTGVGSSPSRPSDQGDAYLLKTDASGSVQWKRTFGGQLLDYGLWVSQTSDGGFILAGVTNRTTAEHTGDGYLVRTDSAGNVVWTRVIGEPGQEDYALCAKQTTNGGYIVTGWMGFGSRIQGEFYQGHLYLMKLAPESRK